MKYKAIIFDLDGTLLNTIDDLANSMNFVLNQHGLPEQPVEDYKMMVGNGMENLVKKVLLSASTDELFVATFLEEFQKRYNENWHKFTKPYPGIEALLESLTAMGVRMSVLSNKTDRFTRIIIDHFFGLTHFDYVYGARVDVPKKPDPAGAVEIASGSNIHPSSFLYLGDSGVDMQTANAAGMFALGATWGFRSIEELKINGVKKLIYDPKEIVELIRGIVK